MPARAWNLPTETLCNAEEHHCLAVCFLNQYCVTWKWEETSIYKKCNPDHSDKNTPNPTPLFFISHEKLLIWCNQHWHFDSCGGEKVAESRSFTNICRRQFPAEKQDQTDAEGSLCGHRQVDAALGAHDVHVCFLFSCFKAATKEARRMCHNLHSLAAGRLALHFDDRAGWEHLVWLGN